MYEIFGCMKLYSALFAATRYCVVAIMPNVLLWIPVFFDSRASLCTLFTLFSFSLLIAVFLSAKLFPLLFLHAVASVCDMLPMLLCAPMHFNTQRVDGCFRCFQIESNTHPVGITERIIYGITWNCVFNVLFTIHVSDDASGKRIARWQNVI